MGNQVVTKDNIKPVWSTSRNGELFPPFVECFAIFYSYAPMVKSNRIAILFASTHHMKPPSPYLSRRSIPESNETELDDHS